MADTSVAVTAGAGTQIDTRTEATNGNHRQVIVIGDPSVNAGVAPVDATTGLAVNVTNATITLASLPAGSANIGDVDIVTMPSIPAGTNNIGDVDVLTMPSIPAGTNNIGDVDVLTVITGTGATNLGKAIDSAVGATDTGVAALVKRVDSPATITPANGDYTALQVNASGALYVTGGGGGTEYVEDVAASADPQGQMLIAVRRDTLSASEVSADGDNIALKATSKGELVVRDNDVIAAINTGAALSIPAGTNNIGDVDVLTVPADPFGANADASSASGSISAKLRFIASTGIPITALPASTNNIGDVDVLTMPADPFGANSDAIVAAGAVGSISAKLRRATQALEDLKTGIVLAAGTAGIGKLTANSGVVIGDVNVNTLPATPAGTNMIGHVGGTEYETVAASQTDQILGATGAVGDYIAGLLIIPGTTSPGAVSIKDGNGSAITVFTGGATSVSNLVPFMVPLGIKCLNATTAGWKVTTGTNVTCIGVGDFT